MNIITRAFSLRGSDERVLDKVYKQIKPTIRSIFKSQIYNKQNYPSEKEKTSATTAILQATWEGNHLLEYIKNVAKNVNEIELEKSLKDYKLPDLKTIKNRFASGIGEETTKSIFFVLATVQKISVLKCLISFLEFCLNNNRPIQYFYESDENLDKYIDLASKTLKSRKSTSKEQKLIPSLFNEDKEKLERYIKTAKEYLENNPEKSLPQADFQSGSEQVIVENNTSLTLKALAPKSRMAQIAAIFTVFFIVLGLMLFSFQQYNKIQELEKIEALIQQLEHPSIVRKKITKLLQNDEISKDILVYIIGQVAEQEFLRKETIPSFIESKINDYLRFQENIEKPSTSSQLFEKGEIDKARQLAFNEVVEVENEAIEFEQSNDELVTKRVNKHLQYAYILRMESKYLEASDVLFEFASKLSKEDERYYFIMRNAATSLVYHGDYFSHEPSLKKALAIYEKNIEYYERTGNIDGIKIEKPILGVVLKVLSNINLDIDTQDKAANIFESLVDGCAMQAPNSECFKYTMLYSSILADRGKRNITTKLGKGIYAERLEESVLLTKEAIRHASSVGEEAKIEAETFYYYIQFTYADNTENEDLKKESIKYLKNIFKGLYNDFIDGKYRSSFVDIFNVVNNDHSYWTLDELKLIAEISKKRVERYTQLDRESADYISLHAFFLRGIWRLEKDTSLLEEAIRYFERSFKYEWPPQIMEVKQAQFGIVLSDYGYATKNAEILKRAAITLKIAQENFSSPIDKVSTLNDLNIVIKRLIKIEDNICYNELQTNIDEELEVTEEFLYLASSTIEQLSQYIEPEYLQNEKAYLDKIRQIPIKNLRKIEGLVNYQEGTQVLIRLKGLLTNQTFYECFPKIPDLPELQKTTVTKNSEAVI